MEVETGGFISRPSVHSSIALRADDVAALRLFVPATKIEIGADSVQS